jgi:hypothetical protein
LWAKWQWGTSCSENFGLLLAGVIPPKFNTHLSSAAGIQTHIWTPYQKKWEKKKIKRKKSHHTPGNKAKLKIRNSMNDNAFAFLLYYTDLKVNEDSNT